MKQTPAASRQSRPSAQDSLLQIQRQQVELQREEVKALNELRDQQNLLVSAVKDLSQAQQAKSPSTGSRFLVVLPALITAGAAIFVGCLVLNFNHWSTRRTARQDHTKMLMDVDSNLIQRPWLWSIYGRSLQAKEGEEEKLKRLIESTAEFREGQEEATMFSCFNMFEAVFDFHRHLGFFPERPRLFDAIRFKTARGKADAEYKVSWDEFAREFFSDKDGRRNWTVFNQRRHLYSKSFGDWVDQSHREGKARAPQVASPGANSGGEKDQLG